MCLALVSVLIRILHNHNDMHTFMLCNGCLGREGCILSSTQYVPALTFDECNQTRYEKYFFTLISNEIKIPAWISDCSNDSGDDRQTPELN